MNDSLKEKEKVAVERLRAFEPDDGYVLNYSGGKDSDAIRVLATVAGVKFKAIYRVTSVDAPESVAYVKTQEGVEWDYPRYKDGRVITMWNLIPRKMTPPLRLSRYCCKELKESLLPGKMHIIGSRWAESATRRKNDGVVNINSKPKTTQKLAEEMGVEYKTNKYGSVILNDDNDESRRMVEHCFRTQKTMIHPIIDWSDADVWDFLHHYGIKGNPLYQCGFKRVGCIGCPMAGKKKMKFEFEKYPKYKENYIRAFDRMLEQRKEKGMETTLDWKSGEEVMDWWLNN